MTQSYRAAATALWGEAGAFAHDAYGRARRLYPELPAELPIVIGITAYGHCTALTRSGWRYGPRITIASNLFARGRNRVEDTVIHEMLHAWLHVTDQDPQHDNPNWYQAVSRLSPQVLGHDLDVHHMPAGRRRKSVRVPNPRHGEEGQPKTVVRKVPIRDPAGRLHARVAGWPHTFRPPGWDRGQPIDCPTY